MIFPVVLRVVEILARCLAIVLILVSFLYFCVVPPNNTLTPISSDIGGIFVILAGGSTLVATKKRTALWRIIACLVNGLVIASAVELLFITEGRPVSLVLAGFLFGACGLAIVWVFFAMLIPSKPSEIVSRSPKGDR